MTEQRWMPIQVGSKLDLRRRRGERVCIVERIPWEMISDERCEQQSQANHGQSISRIAERGGYSAGEAICVIAGIAWQPIGDDEDDTAHRILYAMHCLLNRGRMLPLLSGQTAVGEASTP